MGSRRGDAYRVVACAAEGDFFVAQTGACEFGFVVLNGARELERDQPGEWVTRLKLPRCSITGERQALAQAA